MRRVALVLAAAVVSGLLVVGVACQEEEKPTPTPTPAVRTPTPAPRVTPAVTPTPARVSPGDAHPSANAYASPVGIRAG
jgi:hypothetical protein